MVVHSKNTNTDIYSTYIVYVCTYSTGSVKKEYTYRYVYTYILLICIVLIIVHVKNTNTDIYFPYIALVRLPG